MARQGAQQLAVVDVVDADAGVAEGSQELAAVAAGKLGGRRGGGGEGWGRAEGRLRYMGQREWGQQRRAV